MRDRISAMMSAASARIVCANFNFCLVTTGNASKAVRNCSRSSPSCKPQARTASHCFSREPEVNMQVLISAELCSDNLANGVTKAERPA